MIKPLLTAMILLLLTGYLSAQSISPATPASAADYDQTSTMHLEWTLGELATSTLYHDEMMLTEGSHQPYLQLTELTGVVNPELYQQYKLTVFPNPAVATLRVRMDEPCTADLNCRLNDAQGRILKTAILSSGESYIEMDLSGTAAGNYWLQISDDAGMLIRSFQIVKVRK